MVDLGLSDPVDVAPRVREVLAAVVAGQNVELLFSNLSREQEDALRQAFGD